MPRLRNSDNRTGELFANSKLSSYFIIWETRRGQEGRVGNRQGRPSRLKLYLCTHSLTDLSLTILLLISWKWISQTLSTTSSLSNVTKANPETFFQNIKWKLNEVKGKKRQNNSFLLLNDTSLKLLPLASSVGFLPFIFYYPSIENDVGFRKPSEGSFLIVTREMMPRENIFFFQGRKNTGETRGELPRIEQRKRHLTSSSSENNDTHTRLKQQKSFPAAHYDARRLLRKNFVWLVTTLEHRRSSSRLISLKTEATFRELNLLINALHHS